MLEMRDVYTEEDVYQFQELRQQLDHANKTCRILQYRLRKAERRSLRVAQTGHVDGELLHSLEQDVKVAKDVSVRLHNELEFVEKMKVKLEQENEDLRQRLIETEVAKQVLLNEMDKLKENSFKKRGGRPTGKSERKSFLQEDSADLKCQLWFAKEESTLMCRKLTKLAKDADSMREELSKYNSLYGDLDSTLSVEELADSPHSREAELKVHLKLVEEEANILSRRIVELEVENRGLRAEMDDMKGQGDKDLIGPDVLLSFSSTNYGESGEKYLELGKHLQFVEEEAEVLRRSLMESEDQNKLLMNELNKYKSERDQDITISEDSCSVISELSQEELYTAKIQINELSGKVRKLQYENRVLLTNLQSYDLASCQATRPVLETSDEAGDSAQCIPTPVCRKVPAAGENGTEGCQEKTSRSRTIKCQDIIHTSPSNLFKTKDFENLLRVRDQATLVNNTIEVLICEQNDIKLCIDNEYEDLLLTDKVDDERTNNSNMSNIIFVQLGLLQQELHSFMKRMESGLKGNVDSLNVQPALLTPYSIKEYSCKEEGMSLQIKELKMVLSETNDRIQGLQEQLSQEKQLRKDESQAFNQKLIQLNEDQQKALLRRDFELESLNLLRRLEQKFWSQEKNFLVQESQQFKQTFLLLFMKLKWFLKRWRSGKIAPNEEDDFLEQMDCGKPMLDKASSDLKSALMQEKEDHQHLLAESHGAVMDLTKQLQISQKNWEQEKVELLQRFRDEQIQSDQLVMELQNKMTQALNEKVHDKDGDSEADVKDITLKRTKSFPSMSKFENVTEASPYLPGRNGPIVNENLRAARFVANDLVDSSELNQKNGFYMNNDKALTEHLTKDNLGISSWDYTLTNTSRQMTTQKQMQRSYTAPDKTGIRIYYSPPVVRRLETSLPKNEEGKNMIEPGFLFTMATPRDMSRSDNLSENTYSRWLQNVSRHQHEILDTRNVKESAASVPLFPSALGDFDISGNMSDDMKEITNCVRQAIRSSSLERKVKNTSSQTVGLSDVGTQTIRMVSIGLQTETLRGSVHVKSWSTRSSSLISARNKQLSSSLDKVHSRIERPCCTPKYGSPKLQRRSSSRLDGSKERSLCSLNQSKLNGSAWARSTTTRDSPVLSNINDGLSSLFSVVEHSGSTESLWKPGAQESPAKPDDPKYGIVQEFLRNVCGRSQSLTTRAEKKDRIEDVLKKQDIVSTVPPQLDIAPKTLHKRILKQTDSDEEKPLPSVQSRKDGNLCDADVISTEEAACNCSSQSLTSCVARPSRSTGRQSPAKAKYHPSDQAQSANEPLLNVHQYL
ncbi:microtubule cross-linking factor 2 [Lissotriton helveticus]